MDIDIKVFTLLETLYKALTSSVDDPICVEDPEDGMKTYFSKEDLPLMHERVQLHGKAIIKFYQRHKTLCNHFYTIEEDANTGNRHKVSVDIEKILRGTRELLDFIEGYYEKWGDISPFFHPSYDGFTFNPFPVKPGDAGKVSFNPEDSYENAMNELEVLEDCLGEFQEKPKRLKYPVKQSSTHFVDKEGVQDYYTFELERLRKTFKEDLNFELDF